MRHTKLVLVYTLTCATAITMLWPELAAAASLPAADGEVPFPPSLQSYQDQGQGVLERLQHRIAQNPFNLAATLLFFLAVAHTFLSSRLLAAGHALERAHAARVERGEAPLNSVSHRARALEFLGEIEVVFGLWAIPLMLAIVWLFDGQTALRYVSHTVNFTEALFVVVIMTLASTRPILKLAEALMGRAARAFGGSLTAWWLSILTVGPLLGSFITEPAAITISALLLSQKFYGLGPSARFKYATLGLLFVNVSVGGTLTHFAAPPVLMVARALGLGNGPHAERVRLEGGRGRGPVERSLLVRVPGRAGGAARGVRDTPLQGARPDHLPLPGRLRARGQRDRRADACDWRVGKERLSDLVEGLSDEVEARMQARFLEVIAGESVDAQIALDAFRQRFNEVKLYRFRREFPHLLSADQRAPFVDPNWDQREDTVPAWVTCVHLVFMAFTIVNAHHPALFIPALLFFLGFAEVTASYQNRIDLKQPLLVGFFLGGLVVHGGVQGWWIEPVLGSLAEAPLMLMATVLTAFNDNAAITYLSTLVPGFTDELKYAVVAGAVTGGGLTVIANAPNPAGQAILKRHFDDGVSPAGLLAGALVPTLVLFSIFLLVR